MNIKQIAIDCGASQLFDKDTEQFALVGNEKIEAFAKAILTSEQEPVCFVHEKHLESVKDGFSTYAHLYLNKLQSTSFNDVVPLYLHPSQDKIDAERWRYFIETCSSETGFNICGIDDASNDDINKAIDEAMANEVNP